MIKRVSDCQYDIGARSHMLKTYLQLKMRISLLFLTDSIHVWHYNCLWCVIFNKSTETGQGQIFLKPVLYLENTNSSIMMECVNI